jgi:hypothetical protein
MPTRCSTLSLDLLQPVNVAVLPSPSSVDAQLVFEGMQQRYIATATCSLRTFLWDSAIEVLEGVAVQNIVLLDSLHAHYSSSIYLQYLVT